LFQWPQASIWVSTKNHFFKEKKSNKNKTKQNKKAVKEVKNITSNISKCQQEVFDYIAKTTWAGMVIDPHPWGRVRCATGGSGLIVASCHRIRYNSQSREINGSPCKLRFGAWTWESS
jgi:hypothetical protein